MDENHPPFWLCVLRFCSRSLGVWGAISATPVSPLSCAGMSLGKATELCESVTVSVSIEPRKDQKTAEWGSYPQRNTLLRAVDCGETHE